MKVTLFGLSFLRVKLDTYQSHNHHQCHMLYIDYGCIYLGVKFELPHNLIKT